jgi:hypothetical protein
MTEFMDEIPKKTKLLVIDFVDKKLLFSGELDNLSKDRELKNKEVLKAFNQSVENLNKVDRKRKATKKAA